MLQEEQAGKGKRTMIDVRKGEYWGIVDLRALQTSPKYRARGMIKGNASLVTKTDET